MDFWIRKTLRAVPRGLRYAGSEAKAERIVLPRDGRTKRRGVTHAAQNEPRPIPEPEIKSASGLAASVGSFLHPSDEDRGELKSNFSRTAS